MKRMSRAGGHGRGFIGVPVERRVDKSIEVFCFQIMEMELLWSHI